MFTNVCFSIPGARPERSCSRLASIGLPGYKCSPPYCQPQTNHPLLLIFLVLLHAHTFRCIKVSDVVPRGTASSRGSLEAEFSLPWPRPRSRPLMSWPWPQWRLQGARVGEAKGGPQVLVGGPPPLLFPFPFPSPTLPSSLLPLLFPPFLPHPFPSHPLKSS